MHPMDIKKLKKLDQNLISATVSGRKRLGILGVISLPDASEKSQSHFLFYDFAADPQEPLLPVGTIESIQEIDQEFGPWSQFFLTQKTWDEWSDQISPEQVPESPLVLARAFLGSTGKVLFPDTEILIQRTRSQKAQSGDLGFGMTKELVSLWLDWALMEEEISKNYSRARKQLAQDILEA